MTYSFIRNVLLEGKPDKLEIKPLPYDVNELAPAISEDTINYHYGKLAKTYAERYNANEGDPTFNEAGVFLHNILFQQYQAPSGSNKPTGGILAFIEEHYKSFDKFKEEFFKVAMAIQGSGWAYLAKDGKIKTIKNHEVKKDIVLLIDWWEHSWVLDHQHDKKKYLENQWKIINWDHVNVRNDM
jgi:superoxide dismutase, Fe-Mn family